MHGHIRRHGVARLAAVFGVCAFLVVVGGGTAAVAAERSTPHLAGTWAGKYGGAFSGTFTLHWKQSGSKLTGTIKLSNPGGTYGISGKIRGSSISFGAVGVGAIYSGSVSGKSMSGHYKTPQGGGTWSAHKRS